VASRSQVGLITHQRRLVALAFDGTGALLATATDGPDSTVQVWRLAAGESEKTFTFTPDPPATVTAIALSPNESRLAVSTGAADPVIMDLVSRKLDRQVPSGFASALAYSSDGLLLIVSTASSVKVFNTR
jgi:WD40 repeat protein